MLNDMRSITMCHEGNVDRVKNWYFYRLYKVQERKTIWNVLYELCTCLPFATLFSSDTITLHPSA